MSPFDALLAKLDGIRNVPAGGAATRRARAFCPAHQHPPHKPHRSPSLSVAETAEGAVLLHCHAGCDTSSVLNALGMDASALFPEQHEFPGGGRRGVGLGWIPLAALVDEAANVVISAAGARTTVERGEAAARLHELAGRIREQGRTALKGMRR